MEARHLLAQSAIGAQILSEQAPQHMLLQAFLGLARRLIAEEDERRHRRAVLNRVEVEWLQVALASDDPDIAVDASRHDDRHENARHRHAQRARLLGDIHTLRAERRARLRERSGAAQVIEQARRATPIANGATPTLIYAGAGASRLGEH